jgi:hypothetical protein
MSKLARTLILGAMLAAMSLGMTAVAQAHATEHTIKQYASPPLEPHAGESDRHGQVASPEQAAADAALRRVLARERSSIPSGTPTQVPTPVRPAESSGHSVSLLAWLGVLATLLALAGGLAVMAARRASRRVRAGQTAA